MTELVCKECGSPRERGRRLCKACNNVRLSNYPRYTWSNICAACKKPFKAWRKEQKLCRSCYDESIKLKQNNLSTNNYTMTKIPGISEHRKIAEDILERKLTSNEVIHHLDNNPKNNDPNNLMLMSRHHHGKLHNYLDLQRVIIEKSVNENQGNCWNNLIVPMTTAWLETTNAKVKKLSEIGQSAAEPLKDSIS